MSIMYYIRHCFWGYFILGVFFFSRWYGHSWEELTNRQHIVAVYSMISAALYPFAYYVVDSLGVRFSPNFWQRLYHEEGSLKFFQVIIPMGCFLMAIPLTVFVPFLGKK